MESRERLIDAMQSLLGSQGYAATGLNQLVGESGFPKGSIYHHFPGGKQQIAVEAVRRAGRESAAATSAAFAHHSSPGVAVAAIIDWLAGQMSGSDFRYSCSIAATSLEVSVEAEELRHACAEAFTAWHEALTYGLKSRGHRPVDAQSTANVILSAVEGALMISRATRSLTPMEHVKEHLVDLLDRFPVAEEGVDG